MHFSLPKRPLLSLAVLLRIAGLSLFASILLPPAGRAADPAAVLVPIPAPPPGPPTADTAEWTLSSQGNDITIYSRTRPGAAIKEFKAVGTVNAAPRALLAVLDDVETYPRFMPYIKESRILKRESGSLITYQLISPPFCTERDYSLRIHHETRATPAGPAYLCRWEPANDLGPAEKTDVLRVKINEGSWLIEPAAGNTSRATYCIYTDSGGSLPNWLAVKANQIAINKLFEAIRKQVKDAKYAGSS